MAISRPSSISKSNYLKSSVSSQTWIVNMQNLFPHHHQQVACYFKISSLTRPSSKYKSTSLMCTVSLKTWIMSILYWFKELCDPGDLIKCAVSSLVPSLSGLVISRCLQFQDHLLSRTPTQKALSPRRPEQRRCRGPPVSSMHNHFKTIFWAVLCQLPTPGRPAQWTCRVFPSGTNEWLFKDHFESTILLT